ncbi:MAG TPA: hypothetical protein VFP45_03420 [Candidatus Nitrosotalea sp.]|nr:hypothetical protein [Candidatus Nitrosotalea sp.]
MAASHWEAFLQTPKILMKDWPSIIFHGLLSKIEDSLDNWATSAFPGNNAVAFAMNGLSYTIRQDYLLALTGQAPTIPDPAETFNMSMRVNY